MEMPKRNPRTVFLDFHPHFISPEQHRNHLLSQRGGTTLTELGTLSLLFVDTGSEELGVVVSSFTGSLSTAALDSNAMTLALQALRSNKTLDLRGLGVVLLALLGDGTTDNELADIVLLVETEEFADLGSTLGTKALGVDNVGQTGDIVFTLLDDAEGEDSQVLAGDGTANRLALTLTSAARTVAAVAVGQEELNTVGEENTLLHGETLLIVTTSDLEEVALELITETIARDLSSHALLHEGTELALIVNLDQLLRPVGRV